MAAGGFECYIEADERDSAEAAEVYRADKVRLLGGWGWVRLGGLGWVGLGRWGWLRLGGAG